jgi:hypothetical protein
LAGDRCTKFTKVRRRTTGKSTKKDCMNMTNMLNKLNFYFVACRLKRVPVLLFVDN